MHSLFGSERLHVRHVGAGVRNLTAGDGRRRGGRFRGGRRWLEGGWQGDGVRQDKDPLRTMMNGAKRWRIRDGGAARTIRKIVNGFVPRCLTILKSLRKTSQAQTEANDKVWELNENTEKAMTHLAKIHEKYEEVGKEKLDVDREVDDKCYVMHRAVKMVIDAAKNGQRGDREDPGGCHEAGACVQKHRNVADFLTKSRVKCVGR